MIPPDEDAVTLGVLPPQPDGPFSTLSIRGSRFLSRPASVVVFNRLGRMRTLVRLSTLEEAMAAKDRIQSELDDLGVAAWCERNGIPLRWVTG